MALVPQTPTDPTLNANMTPVSQGLATALRGKINTALAAVEDKAQRVGAWLESLVQILGYGVVEGGEVTAGTGLSVNVDALSAMVGHPVAFDAAQVVGGLNDDADNNLYLREDGTWTAIDVTDSPNYPEDLATHGDYLLWAVVTTVAGSVTAVDNTRTTFVSTLLGSLSGSLTPALSFVNTSVPAGATVANTATQTNFSLYVDFAANSLTVGMVLKVTARGVYGTDAVVSGTLNLRLKMGTTVLCATGDVTNTPALTDQGWSFEALVVITSIGAGGTVEAQGEGRLSTALSTALMLSAANTAAVSVDTTATQKLQLSADWSDADADNTITLRQFLVEVQGPLGAGGLPSLPGELMSSTL